MDTFGKNRWSCMMKPQRGSFYSILLFLLILYLFFFVTARTARCSYNGNDYFVIATDLLNKGMYLEALGMYEEIARYSDDSNNKAWALLFMGTTYSLYLDQYDAALQQFENVIKAFPDSPAAPEALFNGGIGFYKKGEFKRAYEIFTYYVSQYPQGIRRESAELWAESSKTQMAATLKKTLPPRERVIEDTIIRVLIYNNGNKVTVNSEKTITVYKSFSRKTVFHGPGPLTFTKKGKYLAVNGRRINARICRLVSEGKTVMLNDSRYRGSFTISSGPRGLEVVNHVPVEQYLYGVLPKEMPNKWDQEALMAQAVASRTYALYIKEKSSEKPFDVKATTASQVYGGYDAEARASNSAVDATRGQVMTYNGRLIIAYFHADSGGHTEDAKNVWNVDIPYLQGISDRFSKNRPGGEWVHFLSFDAVRNQLNRYGLNLGWIRTLKPAGNSRSGRTLQMMVVSDKGTFVFTSNNFRIKIGETKLKSTLFQIKPYRNGIIAKGNGYGHGVGMSQWGANRMARAGFSYRDILKYYYRGIRIIGLSSL
jgi:stage II sporulation protein D